MKKTTVFKSATAVALMALAGNAMATTIVLPTSVSLRFNFSVNDSATTGYPAGSSCASPTACDALSTVPSIGAHSIPLPGGGTAQEDTWGVGTLDSIRIGSGPNLIAGHILEIVYGGLYDYNVSDNGTVTSTYSKGGYFEIWEHAAPTLPLDPNPLNRNALEANIRTGEKLLELHFGAGCAAAAPGSTATLCGSFGNTTFGGGSAAVLDAIGGTWQSLFDSNTVVAPNGSVHDLSGSFDFSCLNPGPATGGKDGCNPANTTVPANKTLFSLNVNGHFVGTTVPEGNSAAIFLVGALAFLADRRRRFSTKA